MLNKEQNNYIKPSKMFGNLYFVGTYDASTHIIDTGEGLILIDPGYEKTLYMVVNNIWKIGFKPADIKYIVLSHGHADHMEATKSLTMLCGAKTFIGEADVPLVREYFTPDVLLNDGDVISLENTQIKCVSTPGHTDGTMSFFFDVTDGVNTYHAGMFGGAGTNTLVKKYLTENNLPFENQQRFINSLLKIENEKVDIFVGNHVWNNNTDKKIEMLENSTDNPFIDPHEWKKFIAERMARINHIIEFDE